MLKRRASKRFVLAESGEQSSWDSTVDDTSGESVTCPISIIHPSTSSETGDSHEDNVGDAPPSFKAGLDKTKLSVQRRTNETLK